jgi:hypothetical protein
MFSAMVLHDTGGLNPGNEASSLSIANVNVTNASGLQQSIN